MKNTIGELLDFGIEKLKNQNIETYILDSQLLLGKVLNKDRLYLIINRDKEVEENLVEEYKSLISKREERMPIKYILGETEFMGLDLWVEEGVLIPRGDTEILVEEVLREVPEDSTLRICDLCSGSGAIGVALAYYRKNITVESIDYYDIPEKVTKKNINRYNLNSRVTFTSSDLLSKSMEEQKIYDVIVSNPPYIKDEVIETLMSDVKDYEPYTALSGGSDGLYFYRKIVHQSKDVLVKDGILAFEIGHDQGEELKVLMEASGFEDIKIIQDLASLDRVVIGKLKS